MKQPDNQNINLKYIYSRKRFTAMSFSGGILQRAIPEYTIYFKYVDRNGMERKTTTSRTYSLEQLIYIENNLDNIYATVQDKKIVIDNIDNVDISLDEKFNFILKKNKNRKTSIYKGLIAIGLEIAIIIFLLTTIFLAKEVLEKLSMILPILYLVCFVLTFIVIKFLHRSVMKLIIKKKGFQYIANIVEIYDDRAVYNQRIHNRKTQMNRNSTHDFSFIRYSVMNENREVFFDEVLTHEVYGSIFGFNKVPVYVYKNKACIDEDRIFIRRFSRDEVQHD